MTGWIILFLVQTLLIATRTDIMAPETGDRRICVCCTNCANRLRGDIVRGTARDTRP